MYIVEHAYTHASSLRTLTTNAITVSKKRLTIPPTFVLILCRRKILTPTFKFADNGNDLSMVTTCLPTVITSLAFCNDFTAVTGWNMPTLPFDLDLYCSPLVQFFVQAWYFIVALGIPLPIGIIGGWRWGVWLLRRIVGIWYRPTPLNGYTATTAVITPVYNEDPELFRAALRSWAANCPNEIIAVIDHTDKRCMEQFKEFEAEITGQPIRLKMLITHTPGKRPALADGILAATSDIVFLVDSDTIWDPGLLPIALAPFIDAEVGGVTMRQRVWQPHSTAQRIFDVYLDIRYIEEIRFLTAFGDAVTCLSGRTAVYRRFVALTALEDLMEETFWGRPVISGDDKALTLAVQKRGWKVRYQENACVYTPGATVMKVFLKQRLRWARNSWRADLKALGSRWTWRKPFLAFHLMDRMLQPLTTLVAPLFLIFTLFKGHWGAALFVVSWWFFSRAIKISPHLRHHWLNIRVLPWYVGFNYWSAVMKIYAFFTMNTQGWITRWNRAGKAGELMKTLQSLPSYAATAVTVGAVALFVHSLHDTAGRATAPGPKLASVVNVDSDTVTFNPSDWSHLMALPAMNQCSDSWIVNLPAVFTPQTVAAQGLSDAQENNTNAAAPSTSSELCILNGVAKGVCAAYPVPQVTATPVIWESTVGGALSPLQNMAGWLPPHQRWVAVTGSDEAPQLCFLSDPNAADCTGYRMTIPPAWQRWWQTNGLDQTFLQLEQQIGAWRVQPTPAENQLCILAGKNQGDCHAYDVR